MKPVVFKHPKFKEGRISVTWTDKKDREALDKKSALLKKRIIAHNKRMVRFYQDEVRFWKGV